MPASHKVNPRLTGFARRMRREPTDAEKRLWSHLRDRRLGGFKFRRQYPIGGYIVDFYCPSASLAVELDGGQHADAAAIQYDQKRTKRLNELGVRVLRFWDHDLLRDPQWIIETIYAELERSAAPRRG
jgi:very-short-patch-repair endonuclease